MNPAPTLPFRAGLRTLEVGESASSLAAALDAALSEAPHYGGPWATLHGDATTPAWTWLSDWIRQRPGDLHLLGRTLQWLVLQGPPPPQGVDVAQQGPWRRQALVDLCACETLSVLLLPWTEPLAHLWPTLQGTRSATGWGGNPPQLQRVITDQHAYLAALQHGGTVVVDHSSARTVSAKLSQLGEFAALATTTAHRSKSPMGLWAEGRWGWLAEAMLLQPLAMQAELGLVERALASADLAEVAAALQWLGQQVAPGRHVAQLEQCLSAQPSWLTLTVRKKPPGWAEPLRVVNCADAVTWGDVVQRLLTLALRDAAVVLRDDLPHFAVA